VLLALPLTVPLPAGLGALALTRPDTVATGGLGLVIGPANGLRGMALVEVGRGLGDTDVRGDGLAPAPAPAPATTRPGGGACRDRGRGGAAARGLGDGPGTREAVEGEGAATSAPDVLLGEDARPPAPAPATGVRDRDPTRPLGVGAAATGSADAAATGAADAAGTRVPAADSREGEGDTATPRAAVAEEVGVRPVATGDGGMRGRDARPDGPGDAPGPGLVVRNRSRDWRRRMAGVTVGDATGVLPRDVS
jgi:hypothetical protein